MIARPLQRTIALFLFALSLAAADAAEGAIRAPWLDEPYTYIGTGESLPRVLQIFARQFGLKTDIDADIDEPVSGEIAERTPQKFLDRLASMHAFDWYLDNGCLYISAIERRQRKIINAPAAVIGQLRHALEGAGVYQDRFGWGELVGQGQLLIYGPPAYVRRLMATVDMIASAPSGYEIAVIPLKYANVDDRILSYRGKEITIPGVASIVQGIAGSVPDRPVETAPSTADTAGATSAGGAGTLSLASAAEPNTATRSGADAWRSAQGNAVIQPDVRLNALIIKAPPETLSFYKRLIAQLDTEVPLIQIEATILDVDSDYLDNIGAEWALGNTEGSPRSLFSLNPMTATLNTILPRGINLYAKINFLQQNGQGEVISKPSLLTMDNTAALFDSSDTSYIRTRGERVAETKEVSAGLMFKVVPRVIRGGDASHPEQRQILLQIDIEDGKRINDANEELPVFKKSTISTQAIVGDSESLLIAGHQHQEHRRRTKRIPVLGSLPLIGALFRNESESNDRRTRFFIITPRIVNTLQLDNEAALPVFETARGMRAGSDGAESK
ncbi:EscC/YscC/HrcC family type III secretion system outer membrane ring protein [Oxalobacteraceae bacterium CAVE-383]|nr:EscC/YscC/HrcC family type III secretion system outer membrane ring protein [Oxalobacteraceae bacterium CAVE-383]